MAANPAVLELQKVLAAYATATKNATFSPGPIDGVVGDQTIRAVIAVAPLIPGLPKSVKDAIALLPVAMAFPDGRKKAVSVITSNASYIAKAIAATAIYQTIKGGPAVAQINPLVVQATPMQPTYPVAPVSSWAKSPVGIAVIAGGALAAILATVLVVRAVR